MGEGEEPLAAPGLGMAHAAHELDERVTLGFTPAGPHPLAPRFTLGFTPPPPAAPSPSKEPRTPTKISLPRTTARPVPPSPAWKRPARRRNKHSATGPLVSGRHPARAWRVNRSVRPIMFA
jgi:hypothetical protein